MSDLLRDIIDRSAGATALRLLDSLLADPAATASDDVVFNSCVDLSPADYDRRRKRLAARLGIRPSALDAEVANRRARRPEPQEENQDVRAAVNDFNARFFAVRNFGGKCRVCSLKPDTIVGGLSRILVPQTYVDFRNGFLNEKIVVGVGRDGPVERDKGEIWFNHRERTTYDEVVFRPNAPDEPSLRNLWAGFAVKPSKGPCQLYLKHVRENICGGEEYKYDYLIRWMARLVQQPERIGETAIAIHGVQGAGKNVFAEPLVALFGQHGILVSDSRRVTGNFNAHLRDKCVLVADEAFYAGDPRQVNTLKTLITGNTLVIEAKGVDAVAVPNLLHVIILGNDDKIVHATDDDRRFFVLQASDRRANDHEYFGAIKKELSEGGRAALLYHLLYEVDIKEFEVRKVPKTPELRQQQMQSFVNPAEKCWFECLYAGELPAVEVKPDGSVEIQLSDLSQWAKDRFNLVVVTQLWGLLFGRNERGRRGMGFGHGRSERNGPRTRVVPKLDEARRLWNELRAPVEWEPATSWQVFNPR